MTEAPKIDQDFLKYRNSVRPSQVTGAGFIYPPKESA